MNLRLRLIVVFFLLSVVPLAAVTYYTYRNNLRAMRDAAEHESTMLAAELSQRMELVTAQLSLRVAQLMELSAVQQRTAAQASSSAAQSSTGAAVNEPSTASAPATTAVGAGQARELLGDLAVLVNNLEIYDPRRGRGRGRGPFPPAPGGGAPPIDAPRLRPGDGGRSGAAFVGPAPSTTSPVSVPGSSPSQDAGPPDARANGNGGRRGGPPPDTPPPAGDPDRILIDMEPIRREILDQYVPDGGWDELSPEERGRIFAEVGQRMMGIRQGIEIVRQTVTERAAAAAAVAEAVTPAPVTATPLQAPAAPAPPAVAPATPPAPPAPLQRRVEMSGGRLGMSLEQDGEVVSQVSADIDLPNLLSMVFTTTRREQGEVPFAVTSDGRVHTPAGADARAVEAIEATVLRPDANQPTTITQDWIVTTRPDPTNSVAKFGIARPLSDALDELRRTTARNAGFGLAFIALALVGIVPLAAGMTRNLSRLSDGVRRLAKGDYGARVTVRSRDEVGRLAEAFNQMAADVERHRRAAVEQERIRRELELGRQIQNDMLPQTPLRLGLTEVKGVSVPAREVGGDFFNYFQLQDGTVALLVGDVSGKGVGAALLMANIQAALRTRLSLGQDLASLAQELDVDIERSTPGPVYATLFVGILDLTNHRLRCVNAGHNPQYVLRRDGGLERMESTGRPIGLFSGGGYAEQHFDLSPGDVLFFYTDGCVEAENAGGDMFGSERLERALAASAGRGADDVLLAVEAEVSRFRAGVELQDDATMMVVRVG